MKQLPKYFIVQQDLDNPLWKNYIDWLNEKYAASWSGTNYLYYGYDGNKSVLSGTALGGSIRDFQNNPELITLKFWNECVNGLEPEKFVLPEKWTIKMDSQEVVDYCNDYGKCGLYTISQKHYVHFPAFVGHLKRSTSDHIQESYTEITLEQFKKYVMQEKPLYTIKDLQEGKCALLNDGTKENLNIVLKEAFPLNDVVSNGRFKFYYKTRYNDNEWDCNDTTSLNFQSTKDFLKQIKEKNMVPTEKKLKGYKLVKTEYEAAVQKIVDSPLYTADTLIEAYFDITLVKKAGVLDLWFEPVYEDVEKIIRMGGENGFDLKVTSKGIFHKNENITEYVKSVYSFWTSLKIEAGLNYGKLYFNNYAFHLKLESITLEQTGCENKETKLTEWLNVYEEYKKLSK
jgi:hypothetical protein